MERKVGAIAELLNGLRQNSKVCVVWATIPETILRFAGQEFQVFYARIWGNLSWVKAFKRKGRFPSILGQL